MEIENCRPRRIYVREVKLRTDTAKAKVRFKYLDPDNNPAGEYQYWMVPSVFTNEELSKIRVDTKYWMSSIALDPEYCDDDWIKTKGYFWKRLDLIAEPQIIKFDHGLS